MDIDRLYKKRFDGKDVLLRKNEIWEVLCAKFFQKFIDKNSVVLDIAAGYCEFINNIEAKEKIAFDLNPDSRKFASAEVKFVNDSFF